MMSKDFKSQLMKSLGGGVKCIQSTDQNRKLLTYYSKQEVCTQKHQTIKEMNLDQYLPKTFQKKSPELKMVASHSSIKPNDEINGTYSSSPSSSA